MKRILALLLAAMMLLSLAACGNNDDNPSGSENNPGTSQSDNQGGTENQGGEENNGGESSGNEDQMAPKTFTWPTESYTPEKMKWTGAGAITNVKQEEYKVGKFRMAVYFDDATLDEVSAYIDMLKADGFTYWSKYNSAEPALEFTGLENSRMYIWYGLASDGRFIEISIYEKEKTGDYRNDFGNYVDFNYNLHISLYPEKPYN